VCEKQRERERERERIHEFTKIHVDMLTDPRVIPHGNATKDRRIGSRSRVHLPFRDRDGSSFGQPVPSISFVTVHTIVGFLAKSRPFYRVISKRRRKMRDGCKSTHTHTHTHTHIHIRTHAYTHTPTDGQMLKTHTYVCALLREGLSENFIYE